MSSHSIENSVREILHTLPDDVVLVAASKTRRVEEVNEAIDGGVTIIGHNYVQEAEQMYPYIKNHVKWHLIGHLQRNKAKKACRIFDMIQTIDSYKIALAVNRYCEEIDKVMPVLIEVNSGKESNKTGVLPENAESLIRKISSLKHIHIQGLMTMGPRFGNPEDSRPYFKKTKALFDHLSQAKIPHTEFKYLSMGMSNSYKIAIEEGANMVRIGTKLFGQRLNQ
jgi:hypothetical protein